jgi:hypothetical protein
VPAATGIPSTAVDNRILAQLFRLRVLTLSERLLIKISFTGIIGL